MLFPRKIRSLLQLKALLEQDNEPGFMDRIKADPIKAITDIIEDPDEKEYENFPMGSVRELTERMRKEPRLIDILKHDPQAFLERMVKESPQPEFRIYRILVSSLCAIVIIIILGVLGAWFTKNSREAPTLITAVACTTLGLLAGIFVSVPGREMKSSGKPVSSNTERHA